MNKLITILILGMFLISLISAQSLSTGKIDQKTIDKFLRYKPPIQTMDKSKTPTTTTINIKPINFTQRIIIDVRGLPSSNDCSALQKENDALKLENSNLKAENELLKKLNEEYKILICKLDPKNEVCK